MRYLSDVRKYAAQALSEVKNLKDRFESPNDNDKSRNRNDFLRDYGRVLYSSSFRRLQGKMQLLGIDPTHFHRNRLTHSIEVSQIARGIAYDLKLDTTVVTETASLAHDIGNPPFGHSGETVLNYLASDIGGFEGNAQTLRILTTLEKKSYEYRGLNLTFRSLLAVTKYFNKSDSNPKKFIYDQDYEKLSNRAIENNIKIAKSIDCEIMDLSDEIAYAAHDLEDALSFRYLTIDELMYEFKISIYKDAYDTLATIVKECRDFAEKGRTFNTSEEYSFLFRKELTSRIVNTLIRDIGLINHEGKECLGFMRHSHLSEGLKKLLFRALLRKPAIQLYERQGEKIIKGLFEVYIDKKYNKDSEMLPPEFRDSSCESERKRFIIDYIAGMMDSFAVSEYKKYYGETSLNKLYFTT